jgi:hypothetical protein
VHGLLLRCGWLNQHDAYSYSKLSVRFKTHRMLPTGRLVAFPMWQQAVSGCRRQAALPVTPPAGGQWSDTTGCRPASWFSTFKLLRVFHLMRMSRCKHKVTGPIVLCGKNQRASWLQGTQLHPNHRHTIACWCIKRHPKEI